MLLAYVPFCLSFVRFRNYTRDPHEIVICIGFVSDACNDLWFVL